MSDTRAKSRQERLKAALRENLKRRKQQARGKASGAGNRTEGDPDPGGERVEETDQDAVKRR